MRGEDQAWGNMVNTHSVPEKREVGEFQESCKTKSLFHTNAQLKEGIFQPYFCLKFMPLDIERKREGEKEGDKKGRKERNSCF